MTTVAETADALAAGAELAHRLEDLAHRGRRTPCQVRPEAWFAEHRSQQAEAATACGWCPLLLACKAYADLTEQSHGVWGGVPRLARPNPQPQHKED